MNTIFDLSGLAVAGIPLVVGLSSVARGTGMPERYSPLADIVFGILLVTLIGPTVVPPLIWQADIVQGLIIGLSAAGLYNGTKVVSGTLKTVPKTSDDQLG